MTHPHDLPELVRDSELEVTVLDNITIHTHPLECRDSIQPQRWEAKKIIGRGGDGIVILQEKIEGPGAVNKLAVKQMKLYADLTSEGHESKRYLRELEALAKFAQGKYSRHFVRSYGWYQEDDWLYICMEYCKHLDLGEHLRAHGKMPEGHARIIALQVLQGLSWMHKNEIAHRDLKPANIMIHRRPPEDDAWWVVLGDLGLSRRSGPSSGSTTIRGTPNFMAPETIGKPFLGRPQDADACRADMWCLGETITCALTGHGTFSDNEHLLQYQTRRVGFPYDALEKSGASIDAIKFIYSLMEVEPWQRLTVAQALRHSWITDNRDPYTHAHSTATASPVPNIRYKSPKKQSKPVIIEDNAGKVVELNEQKLSMSDQTTQASAQWTQTATIDLDNTQASAIWTGSIANLAMQRNSSILLDQPTVRQRTPKTAAAQTKEIPAINQALSSNYFAKTKLSPRPADRNLTRVAQQRTPHPHLLHIESELLDSFKRFSAAEKLRISEWRRAIATEDRTGRMNDFKSFNQQFQLHTPVPDDLFPILSNDEEKQRQIIASDKRQSLIHTLKNEEKNDWTPEAPQEEQNFALPIVEKTSPLTPRQMYGDTTLPSYTNFSLRMSPLALPPPSSHAIHSASPANQSRPQPKVKVGSETQM